MSRNFIYWRCSDNLPEIPDFSIGPESGHQNVPNHREFLDEIRRRSGERARPTLELDYLKRLLDRF